MYTAEKVSEILKEQGYDIKKRTVNYYAFEKKLFEVESGKNSFTDESIKKIKYIRDLQQYTNYNLNQIKVIINTYSDEEIDNIIGIKLSKGTSKYTSSNSILGSVDNPIQMNSGSYWDCGKITNSVWGSSGDMSSASGVMSSASSISQSCGSPSKASSTSEMLINNEFSSISNGISCSTTGVFSNDALFQDGYSRSIYESITDKDYKEYDPIYKTVLKIVINENITLKILNEYIESSTIDIIANYINTHYKYNSENKIDTNLTIKKEYKMYYIKEYMINDYVFLEVKYINDINTEILKDIFDYMKSIIK